MRVRHLSANARSRGPGKERADQHLPGARGDDRVELADQRGFAQPVDDLQVQREGPGSVYGGWGRGEFVGQLADSVTVAARSRFVELAAVGVEHRFSRIRC